MPDARLINNVRRDAQRVRTRDRSLLGQKLFPEAMAYCARRMPKGAVSGEIIAGLEPVEDTCAAIDQMAGLGAFPTCAHSGLFWHLSCFGLPRLAGTCMIDREKVLAVLQKRFPGSTTDQRAAAANAIVGLDDEWVDVTAREPEFGYNFSSQCGDICFLADQHQQGSEFRILMRRPADA